MKRLVMFDMDGVLFDSMPRHARAWRQTMLDEGLDFPESRIYENEGRTGKSSICLFLGVERGEKEWPRLYERKCRYFDAMPEAPAMPGAWDAVKAVRDFGATAIVVTGSGQKHMLDRIDENYGGLFRKEWMVTAADVVKGKPDPEPYLKGMERAGIPASEAVVIENAPLGVRSGHAAGCYVVAVNTGPLPDEMLLAEGADVLYHSMKELSEHISEILDE